MKISVTIITKNEEENIGRCLDSITWADEIVVLDSGSTDATVEICRRYTNKVYETDWIGFGQQKNRALKHASGEWILSLDADEWITQELREEIQAAISNPGNYSAFGIPRLSSYCGQYIRHSGWWPDYVVRLCRREMARFSEQIIHEKMIVEGSVGRLSNPIMHLSYKDLDHVIEKLNRYTTDNAKMLHAEGAGSGLLKAVLHGLSSFIQSYILRAGFLDGRMGFILAVASAEHSYYKYLKLMMLNEDSDKESR